MKKWIKHINKDGSREHVLSYYLHSNGFKRWVEVRCSTPNCIINKPHNEMSAEVISEPDTGSLAAAGCSKQPTAQSLARALPTTPHSP